MNKVPLKTSEAKIPSLKVAGVNVSIQPRISLLSPWMFQLFRANLSLTLQFRTFTRRCRAVQDSPESHSTQLDCHYFSRDVVRKFYSNKFKESCRSGFVESTIRPRRICGISLAESSLHSSTVHDFECDVLPTRFMNSSSCAECVSTSLCARETRGVSRVNDLAPHSSMISRKMHRYNVTPRRR